MTTTVVRMTTTVRLLLHPPHRQTLHRQRKTLWSWMTRSDINRNAATRGRHHVTHIFTTDFTKAHVIKN